MLEHTLGALDVGEVYEVRFGRPMVEGPRAAVECWATVKEKLEDVALAGCVMLHFAKNGLCKELRDYWILQTGRHQAPPQLGPLKTEPSHPIARSDSSPSNLSGWLSYS